MANYDDDHGYEVEELGGDLYPDLPAAQLAALSPVARIVAQVVREGIESGRFVVEESVVKPAAESAYHKTSNSAIIEAETISVGGET